MDEQIRRAAHELVDRHGEASFDWARARVETLRQVGDLRAADEAWLLLTEVERLLGRGA